MTVPSDMCALSQKRAIISVNKKHFQRTNKLYTKLKALKFKGCGQLQQHIKQI